MTLEKAKRIRVWAEEFNDPEMYELAAKAFDNIGYFGSAHKCRDRAEHYRVEASL